LHEGSNEVSLKIVYFLHFLEKLLLAIVLTLQPLFAENFAVGDGFAEGDGVDEGVFEYSGVGADAGNVVCIILLTEVSKFIGNIQVVELVPRCRKGYWVYFLDL
jgi:hypothetical protein